MITLTPYGLPYIPGKTPKHIRPFSIEGRKLLDKVLDECMRECVAANGFSFPVLAVHATPKGPMAAFLYLDVGTAVEVITGFPAAVNRSFPLRTVYIELATLRSAQLAMSEQIWRREYQKWQREQRPPDV